MPTQKQIQANRRNALQSTGPRTPEGKAISSQNALKSGIDAQSHIIRGEDPASLADLTAQYLHDHHPQSAAERALIDILIDAEWTLRRLRKGEAQLWETQFAAIEQTHNRFHPGSPLPENHLLGQAFKNINETFARLERRRDSLQRAYHRALQDLRQLQDGRPQPSDPPDPQDALPSPPLIHSLQKPNPTIGFVPENLVPDPPGLPIQTPNPPAPPDHPTLQSA
jgi:hypothetical protein